MFIWAEGLSTTIYYQRLCKNKKNWNRYYFPPNHKRKFRISNVIKNNYLSKDDREYCGKIFSCIQNAAESLKTSPVKIVIKQATDFLENAGFEIDYLEAVDANNLSLITKKTNKMLIAVAVIYKKVRLIDNIVVYL